MNLDGTWILITFLFGIVVGVYVTLSAQGPRR